MRTLYKVFINKGPYPIYVVADNLTIMEKYVKCKYNYCTITNVEVICENVVESCVEG